MKVLIAIEENRFPNPFVRTLAEGLRYYGLEVICSDSEFWDNWSEYDIIHIQWPQVLIRKGMSSIDILQSEILKMKRAGKKIVVTCHNFHTHYGNSSLRDQAYSVAYDSADAIAHLGSYSLEVFREKYSNTINAIVPHHIYDSLYDLGNLPSREVSLKKLRLDPNVRYVLCMGAFRDEEEIEVAQQASDYLKAFNTKILAPGLVKKTMNWKHPFKSWKSYKNYKKITSQHPDIICKGCFIPDEDLPYYYAVSDFALIHRKHILNSGNVPMGFMMSKIVVGPDTGNVGPWLKELGNPTFNPSNLTSLNDALFKTQICMSRKIGQKNYQYAVENLKTEKIAKLYVELYKKVISK